MSERLAAQSIELQANAQNRLAAQAREIFEKVTMLLLVKDECVGDCYYCCNHIHSGPLMALKSKWVK